jgi:hypothetical protein
LPDGKALRTLEDARRHILALPKSEHETTAWQVAIEALLIAAEVHVPGAEIEIGEGDEPPREPGAVAKRNGPSARRRGRQGCQ